ncbi:MAG: TRAP transporter small permease [SAR324 cluster bacterium]|nr:TRAP transporter small permease [SAR324 cluster bacterium]
MDTFKVAFDRLIYALAAMSAVSIGLYSTLIPINLVLIKFQLGNIWWLYEGVEYTLYMGAFLAAPWVLQRGAHVRVDVLLMSLSKPAAARLERVIDLFGSIICLVLFVYGVRATISEFQDGTIPDKVLQINNWYMMAVFSFSFLLLAIEFLLRSSRSEDSIVAEEEATPETGF